MLLRGQTSGKEVAHVPHSLIQRQVSEAKIWPTLIQDLLCALHREVAKEKTRDKAIKKLKKQTNTQHLTFKQEAIIIIQSVVLVLKIYGGGGGGGDGKNI